jgi:hypothetical protein
MNAEMQCPRTSRRCQRQSYGELQRPTTSSFRTLAMTFRWGRCFGRCSAIGRSLEAAGQGCWPRHFAPASQPLCGCEWPVGAVVRSGKSTSKPSSTARTLASGERWHMRGSISCNTPMRLAVSWKPTSGIGASLAGRRLLQSLYPGPVRRRCPRSLGFTLGDGITFSLEPHHFFYDGEGRRLSKNLLRGRVPTAVQRPDDSGAECRARIGKRVRLQVLRHEE